jgi:putative transcriptional regulator
VINHVEELRKKAGLTQEQLAELVEVSRQTIISIEKQKYQPSIQLAFKLARYFKIPIENLFDPDSM